MSFALVYGDHELALPLPFEAHIEERLVRMLDASLGSSPPDRVRTDLASRIADVLTSMLENNAVPPSEKQVKYAIAIARELSLQIPAVVLQHRDAMADFLADHAAAYRKSRVR